MLMKSMIVAMILLFMCAYVYADKGEYDICYATGYFVGEDDKFMIGLSMQVAMEKGVFFDTICQSAYAEARDIGEEFSTTSPAGRFYSDHQLKIIRYASDFRSKVNNAIIKLIK